MSINKNGPTNLFLKQNTSVKLAPRVGSSTCVYITIDTLGWCESLLK